MQIGESAFERCYNLKEINFPANLKIIGDTAFKYCNGLRTVSVPPSAQKIDFCAFLGCAGLTEVNVPAGICHGSAFVDCPYIGKSLPEIPESFELDLVGNPYRFTIYSDVPEEIIAKISPQEYLDLGEDYVRCSYLNDGDLLYTTGEDCFFSRDMLDSKAELAPWSCYGNNEFTLEAIYHGDRRKGSYLVMDRCLMKKAEWKYRFDLGGNPFTPNLFMFKRYSGEGLIYEMLEKKRGSLIFEPEKAYYCEKPCSVEFVAGREDRKVRRYIFQDRKFIKKIDYELR